MNNSVARYDENYYLRGRETGLSLYENYRWLPELTLPMCKRIVEVLGIRKGDTICDFGCARGYTVKALRELGHKAYGIDASAWAIQNSDAEAKRYLTEYDKAERPYDYIIAKDVLEHIPDPQLTITLANLIDHCQYGLFVVVPLSPATGAPYVIPEYEQDVTHVQRLTLNDWVARLTWPGFCTTGTYRIAGIKDNWYNDQYAEANGFIICRRIEDPISDKELANAYRNGQTQV